MTRKIIAILTVAAMLFALPFIATADNQGDYLEQELEVAVPAPAPAELPSVGEPAAEEVADDSVADETAGEEASEDALEEDEPDEGLLTEEDSGEEIAQTDGELEEATLLSGPITVGDMLDYLYDALWEIRDRVEADFDYILANPGSFPDGDPNNLAAIIQAWNDDWADIEYIFDNWDDLVQALVDAGMTPEQAALALLDVLSGVKDIIELYYLNLLRVFEFDVVATCDNCDGDTPVGACECFCWYCRGHGFDDPTHDCSFCQPQPGDGYCPDCDERWYNCGCGTDFCGDCLSYPCTCPQPTPVNRAALSAAIGIADGKVQADFTPASWDAFIAVLEAVRAVYANPNATQAQINAALAELLAAKGELVRVNQPSGERITTTVVTAMVAPQTGDETSTQAPLVTLMISLFAISGLSLVKFRMRKQ